MKLLKSLTIMAGMTLLLTSSTCSDMGEMVGLSDNIIGKPVVKVENGKFTPELLNSLGRVGGVQVSPDGKRILYGVTYMDIAQNKGNCELWSMNVDGSDSTQLTKTPSSESGAVWIDGGKKIAFVYEGQLWVMNSDVRKRWA